MLAAALVRRKAEPQSLDCAKQTEPGAVPPTSQIVHSGGTAVGSDSKKSRKFRYTMLSFFAVAPR